jgi:hypothetical protein
MRTKKFVRSNFIAINTSFECVQRISIDRLRSSFSRVGLNRYRKNYLSYSVGVFDRLLSLHFFVYSTIIHPSILLFYLCDDRLERRFLECVAQTNRAKSSGVAGVGDAASAAAAPPPAAVEVLMGKPKEEEMGGYEQPSPPLLQPPPGFNAIQ